MIDLKEINSIIDEITCSKNEVLLSSSISDLGLDSLDLVELLGLIEERTNKSIDLNQLNKLGTIHELLDLINNEN